MVLSRRRSSNIFTRIKIITSSIITCGCRLMTLALRIGAGLCRCALCSTLSRPDTTAYRGSGCHRRAAYRCGTAARGRRRMTAVGSKLSRSAAAPPQSWWSRELTRDIRHVASQVEFHWRDMANISWLVLRLHSCCSRRSPCGRRSYHRAIDPSPDISAC